MPFELSLVQGPLDPAALEQLERRLAVIDRSRDIASTAARIEAAALALTSGRPEPELCELIAALALWCRYQCGLRDRGRPSRIPNLQAKDNECR